MPRPKRADEPVRLHIFLPQSLFARLELALYDPIRAKAKYGTRSALIESLLRKWLEENERSEEC